MPTSPRRTLVIAGYIIANRPIGTPRLISAGTDGWNVPAAIDLIASIGGVSAKSEMLRAFPMRMPTAMLNRTRNGRRRKSSSLSSMWVIAWAPASLVSLSVS